MTTKITSPTTTQTNRRAFLTQVAGVGALTSLQGSSAVVRPESPGTLAEPSSAGSLYGERRGDLPLLGLAEWFCWYVNFSVKPPDQGVIEGCIDAHQAVGIDHLVWSVGRAVVEYHSSNPANTWLGELGGNTIGGDDWTDVFRLFRADCPTRRAIKVCHERGLKCWGRLGMNRHYNAPGWMGVTSRFSLAHPEWRERTRVGRIDNTRLCYAFDEVQAERLGILREVQQLGMDGLVYDFCRQPPITRYHPRWIELYQKTSGRRLPAGALDEAAQTDWFQFRANIVTAFLRAARDQARAEEKKTGRACPLIARVPATSLRSNLAAGLDISTWLREDFIDGVMLSPLVFCAEAQEFQFATYAKLAHQHGKSCIGGLGSLELIRNHVPTNTGFFQPQAMHRLLALQHEAGVDAMSIYQSESLVRMDYLREHLAVAGDAAAVRVRAKIPDPAPAPPGLGQDWHTSRKGKHPPYTQTAAGEMGL